MKTISVDVAIIGAGTAGLVARRKVARRGKSVLLIEGGRHGTTCARTGCMPSKLLIQAADVAHEIRQAWRFGLDVPQVQVRPQAVLERVRLERDRFVDAVVQSVDRLPPGECLQGYARFVAPGVLEVDSHTRVEARAVVIATGSSVVIPPELASVRDRLLTTNSIFELPTLPATLAVVGGGTVGVELGQALARLGVRVTLLSRGSTLGPASDPQVQAVLREQLGQELELLLSSRVTGATPLSEGIRLSWEQSGRSMERVFEAVLVASGRRPNVKGLHLEAAGIPLDDQGVPMVDEATLQCGETPVFCAGDANDGRNLLHEASDEGRIAGINAALWPLVKPHPRRTPLSIVFSDPQVALVGLRFQQLEAGRHVIGEARFDDQGRARIMGRNAGVIRVYADQTGRLVGAELVGPRAEHMAHHLAWTIQQGLTVETILGFPFYHPVLEECLRSALQDLAAKVRRQPTRLEPLCG